MPTNFEDERSCSGGSVSHSESGGGGGADRDRSRNGSSSSLNNLAKAAAAADAAAELVDQDTNNKIHNYSSMMGGSGAGSQDPGLSIDERLKILYPMVNEEETPLPRSWSVKDKFNFIGLSHSNLRVQYKGNGKTHKEASSVRATHSIPASCGIYYFEVKIVSKGRDGYMGVGLSAQGVNMNRLPGWDKHSYGYHGDDGHSFCSSGTGQSYGPTFTTGDVIGCGLNLIDRSCFYTKNGHNLGVAFTNLPSYLYPTVGLQTPGGLIDANFGQEPFVFDIEGEMKEYQLRIHRTVENFPPPGKHGDWESLLHKMVSSYLVHQGFSATAEAFLAKSSANAGGVGGHDIIEDFASIRNRQSIQKLVLAGRMGEAIAMTNRLYPHFLHKNPSLHFMLKIRQFIEMVAGNDHDDHHLMGEGGGETAANGNSSAEKERGGGSTSAAGTEDTMSAKENDQMEVDQPASSSSSSLAPAAESKSMAAQNGSGSSTLNGNNVQNGDSNNGTAAAAAAGCSVVNNPVRFGKLIQFGRHLQTMLQEMEKSGVSSKLMERNRKMQQDAFALVAYPDPWDSPLGWQLNPGEREFVSNALNSAILDGSFGRQAGRPPMEVALIHSKQLVKLMANNDLGACAFANVDDFIK